MLARPVAVRCGRPVFCVTLDFMDTGLSELRTSSAMLPLTAEEWFSTPEADEEEDDPFAEWPRSPVKRKPGKPKLTRNNLSLLGSDAGYKTLEQRDSDVATEEDETGELRPLGGFEWFFWKGVANGLGLIYYIVDIEGPVTATLLRHAARMTVKRHPNLRSRVINGMLESVPFEECQPIEVPFVETEDVIAYTEDCMKESKIKEGSSLYLWRLALHRTPTTGHQQLVFLIHHTISDGDSILRWFQSLIELMATLAPLPDWERRAELRKVEPLRQLPSADVQLHSNYTHHNYVVNHFRPLLKEAWNIVRRPRVPKPLKHTYKISERTTRISSFSLEPADFKRLMQACKLNGTSVTGALTAACLVEMQDYIRVEAGPRFLLKAEVLVNFRGKVQGDMAEDAQNAHQLYAAPVDVLMYGGNTPETRLSFWDAARQVKREVDDFLHMPHLIVDALEFFYTLGKHPIATTGFKLFSISPKQGRYKALSVSNLGRTDGLFVEKGGFRLGRMQMGIDEVFYGHSIFLAVASHQGRLNFTLSYAEPIVSREMAERYGNGVIKRCIDAAGAVLSPQATAQPNAA